MPVGPSTATDGQTALRAERRQVTALCYDLVGSTRLSDQLDPEDMQEVQQSFHDVCTRAVNRLGGYVESYTGDGAMALFGYPRGHEDSASRAIYAGLDIVNECRKLSVAFADRRITIAVRVGVATGTVVTHHSGSDRVSLVGMPLNIAFKLQAATDPNTVLVSGTTRTLAGRLFQYEMMGNLQLGGLARPQHAWRAIQPRHFRTRFQGARISPLTPLMARETEMQKLADLWRQAEQGSGQVVLVAGEPGIGKSRLASAFARAAAYGRQTTIFFQCSSLHRDTSLYPVVVQLEHFIRRSPTDSKDELRGTLRDLLSASGMSGDSVELLAHLLDISSGSPWLPSDVNKERTIEALIEWALQLSGKRPLLMIVEDIQWIDPTTQELLDALVDRISGRAIMVMVTCRPEYRPAWIGRPNVSSVTLDRLSRTSSATIVEHILRGQAASRRLVEQIVQRADGIPLFVEELTTAAIDSGLPGGAPEDPAPLSGHVPPSLSDSLIARLDQLGPDKEVAQICSAIGRTFALSIAQKVSTIDDGRVARGIERLVSLGLATIEVGAADVRYSFRHALIQEAAYESMLRNQRVAAHRMIAEVLDRDYAGTRDAAPEIVGHHLAEGGLHDKAALCFHEAGKRAASASANIEAKRLLERALACLSKTGVASDRVALELPILNSLGPILITINGPGSPEVEQSYKRALELSSEVPDGKQQFVAHWGWWRIAPNADELRNRAHQLLELATKLDDLDFKLQAHHCQWATLFNSGHLAECLEHIDKGIEIYERGDYKSHGTLYGGHDPKVCAYGEKALLLWLTGYPDQALRAIEVAIGHAESLRHAGSIGHARDIEIMLLKYRRDVEPLLSRVEAMITFAEEQGFRDLSAKALVFKGWALSQTGRSEAGFGLMEAGLALQRKLATQEDIPVYLEMLAEVHADRGEPEPGIPLLDEAISMVNASGLIYWLAQLYCRKGDLIRQTPGRTIEDAILWYDRATETAAAQGARALVLRAALGKARLLDRSDARERGRTALAEIHASFTEGFDSVDLLDASQFLDGLR